MLFPSIASSFKAPFLLIIYNYIYYIIVNDKFLPLRLIFLTKKPLFRAVFLPFAPLTEPFSNILEKIRGTSANLIYKKALELLRLFLFILQFQPPLALHELHESQTPCTSLRNIRTLLYICTLRQIESVLML